jgi:hypothetical protein
MTTARIIVTLPSGAPLTFRHVAHFEKADDHLYLETDELFTEAEISALHEEGVEVLRNDTVNVPFQHISITWEDANAERVATS